MYIKRTPNVIVDIPGAITEGETTFLASCKTELQLTKTGHLLMTAPNGSWLLVRRSVVYDIARQGGRIYSERPGWIGNIVLSDVDHPIWRLIFTHHCYWCLKKRAFKLFRDYDTKRARIGQDLDRSRHCA